MNAIQALLGATALAAVGAVPGNIAAQGLPPVETRVDSLESKVEALEEALSQVTNKVVEFDSRAASLESNATLLSERVGSLEERLDALEGALAGLTCPDGQFLRGFNTSGDILCAVPVPQDNPEETIDLPQLATALYTELNELLAMNATFAGDDVTGQSGVGSFSLTDIALQLTCAGECVAAVEARTPGDGSTLIADYDIDGTIEVTGAAEITSDLFPDPVVVTFVIIYENIGVNFVAQIDQLDRSVVSVISSSSPDTTDVEVMGGGAFGAFVSLFVNLFQSELNGTLNAFFDDIHSIALGALEPIDLPLSEM